MALHYSGVTMGTFTLVQNLKEEKKYRIEIRQGNCLAIFLYVYKIKEPEDPKRPWMHQLVNFFASEQHLKNCVNELGKDVFRTCFSGELKNIRLNLYHKECQILLKYMVRAGLRVHCYYKDPKQTRQ